MAGVVRVWGGGIQNYALYLKDRINTKAHDRAEEVKTEGKRGQWRINQRPRTIDCT